MHSINWIHLKTGNILILLCMILAPLKLAHSIEPCAVEAYLTDPDPQGTNIRQKPTINSAILQTLPPSQYRAVRIEKVQGEWLWVAASIDYMASMLKGSLPQDKQWKPVQGWISASLVAINDRGRQLLLREAPNIAARVIMKLPEGEKIIKILDCKGRWIKGELKYNRNRGSGWIPPEEQCSNPLTTCP